MSQAAANARTRSLERNRGVVTDESLTPPPPPPPPSNHKVPYEGNESPSPENSRNSRNASNNSSNGIRDSRHKRSYSADGSISDEILLGDVFGNQKHHPSRERPPAPVTRQRSLEQCKDSYHKQNQMFLQRVRAMMSPSVTSSKQFLSPSPSATFRKRLPSIDEGKINDKNQQGPPSEVVTGVSSQDSLGWSVDSRDDSVSSLGSQASFLNSSYNTLDNDLGMWSPRRTQEHQVVQFDHEQQERQERAQAELERNLASVLDRHFDTQREKSEFIRDYLRKLEQEREELIAHWKTEQTSERETTSYGGNCERKPSEWWTGSMQMVQKDYLQPCLRSISLFLANAEVVISNMPLTIGAIGLGWFTNGVVWFKFMEENVDSCVPVHFHSDRCHFPEFPGCFECDTSVPIYRIALYFHYFCASITASCCILFLLKVLLAWRVVSDELSNPTTSAPCGVVCIAMICVSAALGKAGEPIVLAASTFHFCLAFWFLYMAIFVFRLWPDPGWFPNTVGIGYAAVKTWLFFPTVGWTLMTLCVIFFLAIFFISVVRVATNRKISAPVCWIQLSAPSIAMYCFSLASQPNRVKELLIENSPELHDQYQEFLSNYYLPTQHMFMVFALIGVITVFHSLWVRWDKFSQMPFSPAHAAFCFPTLSHTNSVQAYRSAVNAFSSFPNHGVFKTVLFAYWTTFLVGGTILNVIFSIKYFSRLAEWTKINVADEDEPPRPNDTFVHEMLMEEEHAHEVMLAQPFVSPAVLQANEAGALIRVRRGSEDFRLHGPFVRTRKVQALGFDPTMSDNELRQERARLLDWVATNAPRTRNRTMSIPMMMKLLTSRGGGGFDSEGTRLPGDDDAYGTFEGRDGSARNGRGHGRSQTSTVLPMAGI